MAIEYVGHSSSMAISTGAITVTLPSGWAEGDLFQLHITGANAYPAAPSGWTSIGTALGNNGLGYTSYHRLCYKVAGSGESDVSVADSGNATAGIISCWRGVDTSDPINVYGTNTSSGTTVTANGVTTTVDGAMVVHSLGFVHLSTKPDSNSFTSWSNSTLESITEGFDYIASTGFYFCGLAFVYGMNASSGSSGNSTSPTKASFYYPASGIITVALTPASEGDYADGGASAGIAIGAAGGGTKMGVGGSASFAVLVGAGAGSKAVTGGEDADIVVSIQGAGLKLAAGGSGASLVVAVAGTGETAVYTVSGGSEVPMILAGTGAGAKLSVGGAAALSVMEGEGSGVKIALGGEDAVIILTTDGEGMKANPQGGAAVSIVVGGAGAGTKTAAASAAQGVMVLDIAARTIAIRRGGAGVGTVLRGSAAGIVWTTIPLDDRLVFIRQHSSGAWVRSHGSEVRVTGYGGHAWAGNHESHAWTTEHASRAWYEEG